MGDTDGQPKSPDWAAPLCGVDPDTIRALAARMASTRTLITVAWSLQRAEHGEQPYWMSAVLAAMLGQIGLPGGGVGYGYGAIGGVGKSLLGLRGMTFPQLTNPVRRPIPVARIGDMLRNPGQPYDFNGQRRTYPDIRLIYWAGGNPYHHHQDLNALHEAWQRPETIIVNEPWWTATAKRADIVFPATTPYEREDIGRTNLDDYLFHMPPLIPPVGEARDDYDIFAGLARRMGVGERFTEGLSAGEWVTRLYAEYRDLAAEAGIDVPDLDNGSGRRTGSSFRSGRPVPTAPSSRRSGRTRSPARSARRPVKSRSFPTPSPASATTIVPAIPSGCPRRNGRERRRRRRRCTSFRRNPATSFTVSSNARGPTSRARAPKR
jgi:biotin/methionine sulfoxide reductase